MKFTYSRQLHVFPIIEARERAQKCICNECQHDLSKTGEKCFGWSIELLFMGAKEGLRCPATYYKGASQHAVRAIDIVYHITMFDPTAPSVGIIGKVTGKLASKRYIIAHTL